MTTIIVGEGVVKPGDVITIDGHYKRKSLWQRLRRSNPVLQPFVIVELVSRSEFICRRHRGRLDVLVRIGRMTRSGLRWLFRGEQ